MRRWAHGNSRVGGNVHVVIILMLEFRSTSDSARETITLVVERERSWTTSLRAWESR